MTILGDLIDSYFIYLNSERCLNLHFLLFRDFSATYGITVIGSNSMGYIFQNYQQIIQQFDWDFLSTGGKIPSDSSPTLYMVHPNKNSADAAKILARQIIRGPIEIDVTIWRDSNIFVFMVENQNEVKNLFVDPVIMDQAKVIALKIVSDRFMVIFYRGFHHTIKKFIWEANNTNFEMVHEILDRSGKNIIHGGVLRTSYTVWPPNVLENMENGTVKNLWGFEITLLENIAVKLGLKTNYQKPVDGEWGNIKVWNNNVKS